MVALVYLYLWGGISVDPIRADGWGHYSYLPAIFDYHQDLSFSFSDNTAGSTWADNNGNIINKYPIGVSIFQFPFFIIVDVVCKLFAPQLATGYTSPYQIAVLCATSFYFLCGIYFMFRVLQKHFSDKVTGWVLLSIIFGTSLFHYATYDASFSHIYSFFAISAFVFCVDQNKEGWRINFILGLLCGLILVTRNPNAVVILFYLFYEIRTPSDIKKRMICLVKPNRFVPNILGGLLPVCLQCLYWYNACGKLIIRSYSAAETFSWLKPHIVESLFSVSKGLVFYSPIIGIALCGMFAFRRTQKGFPLWAAAVVILVHMYITVSWDCWWYGGSYGQRPFVDVYIFYALFLGSVYEWLDSRHILNFFIPILCALMLLSIKFMLAYWHGVLPFEGSTIWDIIHVFEWNFDEVRIVIRHVLLRE